MAGIQVDPMKATNFAQEHFGADYARHVIELAQFQAFGEAASTRIDELERENAELTAANARLERLAQESQALVGELRRQVDLINQAAESEHGIDTEDTETPPQQ
jgi:Tfp pilus assembly protein PilN